VERGRGGVLPLITKKTPEGGGKSEFLGERKKKKGRLIIAAPKKKGLDAPSHQHNRVKKE